MSLNARLAFLRAASGLSAGELAELAGLAPSLVAMIERGERGANGRLAVSTAASLARVLGCTIDWLVSGHGTEPDDAAVLRAVARAQREHEDPANIAPDVPEALEPTGPVPCPPVDDLDARPSMTGTDGR